MTTSRSVQATTPLGSGRARTVLVETRSERALAEQPMRWRYRLLARVMGHELDGRLAAGERPESARLLAIRAAMLLEPSTRRRLAQAWDEVTVRARGSHAPFDPRVRVAADQVDAAADEIARIATLLRSDRPVSARGVAAASLLLTSPDSPVHRIGRGADDIATAICRAIEDCGSVGLAWT